MKPPESFTENRHLWEVGIYRSTDSGDTWTLIASTANFKYITDIVIRDENGTSVIYAGVCSGVYKGSNFISNPSDGLYRSDDNGETWEQVLPNISGKAKPYSPARVRLASDGRIFIGTMRNLDGDGGATILYSDLGTTDSWTVYDKYENIIKTNSSDYNIPGRVIVAPAPSDANRVYAIIGTGYKTIATDFTYSKGSYVLRSDDGGQNWIKMKNPTGVYDYWATLAWHAFEINVNPDDPDMVYIGGLDVYKSDNGGSTWSQLSDWFEMYSKSKYKRYYREGTADLEYIHGDIHKFVFNPANPNEMIVTSDGGVFKTSDALSPKPSFTDHNKNYNTLQFYTGAIETSSGEQRVMGGTQDNGTLIYTDAPLTFEDLRSGGDGAYCFFDNHLTNTIITSSQFNFILIHHDNEYKYYIGDYHMNGIFINPTDYDPVLKYLYSNAVDYKRNIKNNLVRVKNTHYKPTADLVKVTNDVTTAFSTIKVSPFNQNDATKLFLGTESGRLFEINNAHSLVPSHTEIGSPQFPTANISSIDIGNTLDTLIVTFSNYGVSSIWQTYDGGATWSEKEGNLPDMPIRWIIYHPNDSKKAMIATEIGVWFTDELDEDTPEWVPVNDGLADVRVDMLRVRETDMTVLAATHGRGLAVANFGYLSDDLIKADDTSFEVYPNPADSYLRIRFLYKNNNAGDLSIFDQSGKQVYSETDISFADNYHEIDVSSLSPGIYIMKFPTANRSYSKKIVIN